MKKLIKLEFDNTTRERKTEDSYSELYSHDKNNGSFEFEILNDTLTTEQVIALFKFTESNKIWKTTGTVEGNKVNVIFDTSLITQNETVICYLYFDEEQRTSDTYRFKFKVKVSEIDKLDTYAVKERYFNKSIIVDKVDVVTKDELKEALKNVGGVATEGLLTEVKAEEIYAKKTEIPQAYDDRRVNERLEALETKTDNDTVYNDTDLRTRVEALENRPTTSVTAYDDSDLKRRVSELEQRPDNNTVYDDTALSNRVKALEDAPKVDATNFATKNDLVAFNGELNNKVSSVDFEAFKTTIPTSYNDKALSDRVLALENKPVTEIHGTGMPNGVVEAEIGTTYVDKNKTNGAFKWIKTTNGGNQGWEVLTGDTGWRQLNISSKLTPASLHIRRVNNMVTYQFGGLSWGWFGIVRRGGEGYVAQPTDLERNCFILNHNQVPEGFRTPNSLIGSIYNDNGVAYGTWYVGNAADVNHLRFQFLNPVPTDRDIGDIRVSTISYFTDEPWPQQLP